ncbi:M12 family metallo-peptidase [Chryseobacterium sp. PBS4-4]|uniref:M12 family metallo-peptidase n=1 Tax=Chryseobacterium edaphi TaxID=2976532 RepID=A0ABT2W8X7_9FLAO|nr:M12 family metallo-peptidase [Chryseobacterium edaphi]MCU7618434.1 M12 family metallo-peptidase [Chryseobacterium edaphi]
MKNLSFILLFSMSFFFGQNQRSDIKNSFAFNFANFKNQFENSSTNKKKITGRINLPVPGTLDVLFNLTENDFIEKRIPNIITFNGVSKDNKFSMKLTLMNDSFSAAIKSDKGEYFFIEKIENTVDRYRITTLAEASGEGGFVCNAELDFPELNNELLAKSVTPFPLGTQIKKFRLAVATRGESAQALGNTDLVLAQVVSKFNAVSLAYESELAVTFTLIAETTNKTLIFSDPSSDPYSTTGPAESSTVFQNLNASGVLTYNKYDIGHTVEITTGSSTSGSAGGTPCSNTSKAAGFTNFGTQSTLASATQVLCHEMGHQFGAGHTFNAGGGCAGSWSANSAVEPGAGSTFLAYANLCSSPVDVRYIPTRDIPFFHARSMDQILTKIQNTSNCYTIVTSSNIPPVANAGVDITIPKNTPFKLIGLGSDANNTSLTYTWDQNDLATTDDRGAMGSTLAGEGGYTAVNSTTAPLFRSQFSNVSGERYFPAMEYVLNNQNIPPLQAGEALSNVGRDINLRFAVRDNNPTYGGIDSDDIVVTVSNTGPLSVSYPNASGVTLNAGSNINVTWDVNNTNTLKNTVNILLSTDGGLTFPLILAENTPNNGSKNITIPNVPSTTTARIKVVAIINSSAEFFDISDTNFTINSTCAAYATYAYPTDAVTAVSGSALANLNMTAPQAVESEISSFVNNYSNTSVSMHNLIIYNNSNLITPVFRDVRNGMVKKFKVTISGNYVINKSAGYMILSLASGNPFTTANFVSSGGFVNDSGNGVSVYSSTKSAYLTEGTDYYLFLSSASSSGATHTITIDGPGKMLFETMPPSGYSYLFAAVGNNGNIITTSATADFTTLPPGTYTIQGFSYLSTINPSTFVNQTFSNLILAGNCINLSKRNRKLTLTSTLSTSDLTYDKGIKFAPNPVNDFLYVITKKKITHYDVYDMSGRNLLYKNKFTDKIDFRNFSSGNYILRLYENHVLVHQVLVIKK